MANNRLSELRAFRDWLGLSYPGPGVLNIDDYKNHPRYQEFRASPVGRQAAGLLGHEAAAPAVTQTPTTDTDFSRRLLEQLRERGGVGGVGVTDTKEEPELPGPLDAGFEGTLIEHSPGIFTRDEDGKPTFYRFNPDFGWVKVNAGNALEIKSLYDRSLTGDSQAMTEYQRRSIELQEREFEARGDTETSRLQDQARWETMRQQLLGTLRGPSDWIAKWQLENKENPFAAFSMERARANQARFIEGAEARVSQLQQELLETDPLKPDPMGLSGIKEKLTEMNSMMKTIESAKTPIIQPKPTQVVNPPAPFWLQQFAPGQVTGQPITQERLAPISGQALTRTGPDVLAGLSGFAEFSGQSFTDLLRKSEIMQPRTPRTGGRTTPIAQR